MIVSVFMSTLMDMEIEIDIEVNTNMDMDKEMGMEIVRNMKGLDIVYR